jgi:SAM-dependent methyltransferase
MSEYSSIFDARGGHYNLANHRFPEARREEARALFSHFALSPGDRPWLDVAAGGGYLAERARAEGIARRSIACDASLSFLLGASAYQARSVSQYAALPFADATFAGAGCLAALHHAEEPERIFAELLRVVAPGGRAAVGDVAAESPPARFLNDFVDGHTETGHRGRFHSAEALGSAFAAAGGNAVRSQCLELCWRFDSRADAVAFSRELFGLRPDTSDEEIESALDELGLEDRGGKASLPWRMAFVSAGR